MFGNLFEYNYRKVYKKHLMDFGLIYVELKNVRFKKNVESTLVIKDDLSDYLKSIIRRLHEEYEISDYNYKLSKDKSVFKSNYYLLGIEIKSFKKYIEEKYDSRLYVKDDCGRSIHNNYGVNYKDEFGIFLNYIVTRLNNLIYCIEKEVLKWNSHVLKKS